MGWLVFKIEIYKELDSGNDKTKRPSGLAILHLSKYPPHVRIWFKVKYSESHSCLGDRAAISKAMRCGPSSRNPSTRQREFMVWSQARRALSGPSRDLCKITSLIGKARLSVTLSDMLPKTQNSYSDYTLIGTLYSTRKKTHHKQKLFFSELCEVKVSGSCVNYIIFMEFSMWVKSAKAQFSALWPYIY